ncbi:MAG: hypothetical protein ABI402_03265 [Ferruginibacter sp.]
MKYIKYLLTTSLLAVIFLSCKKEHNPFEDTYSIKYTTKALPYVQLPENHYRIYKDSATGVLDSIIITKSELGSDLLRAATYNGFHYAATNYETFKLQFTKYTGSLDSIWLSASASLQSMAFNTLSNKDTIALSLTSTDILQVFYLANSDVPATSLLVEGINYNEVVVTIGEFNVATDPSYKKTINYWAKNVGLIKRTDISFGGGIKTWTLLRYN